MLVSKLFSSVNSSHKNECTIFDVNNFNFWIHISRSSNFLDDACVPFVRYTDYP
jgi:hypothetical protein